MFTKKKMFIVGAVCVAVIGASAFILMGGGAPGNPVQPGIVENEPPPTANVGGITSPATVTPGPIVQVSPPTQTADAPVIDPDSGKSDVVVPFIPEVTKPPEAETDTDKGKHEPVEGANPSEPPATDPPRQPVTTEPPKQTEPKGGDTNSQGQVWVPGFGWVTPGGPNQVIPGESDGDINKQVGNMGNKTKLHLPQEHS